MSEVPDEWLRAVHDAYRDAFGQRELNLIAPGLPVVIEAVRPLIETKAQRRGDIWQRKAVEIEQDRDRLLAELDRLQSLRFRFPAEAVIPDVHTPERIGAYLRARGWSVDTPGVLASLWAHPERPGKDGRVLVPSSNLGSDYQRRVAELATDVAALHGTGELGVLAEIAAIEAAEVPGDAA